MPKDNDNLSKTGIFIYPRSVGFPSQSLTVASQVHWVSVPGPTPYRPRSAGFASQVRSFVGDLRHQKAQNAENRPRSREELRTGDGKGPDRGRKTPGPATEPYGPATVLQIRHFLPIFVIYKREVLHA